MHYLKKLSLVVLVFGLFIKADQLDVEYSKDFTDLVELVYGSDFLSQGGSDSIDRMFQGQNLDGKRLLDIGSGLGGVEFYLAQKYTVDIVGIDCVSRLVDDANKKKEAISLKGSVAFVYQDPADMRYPYADNSFDIVFSKESLLHVTHKGQLLKEVFRILKPGGKLIILDWLVDSHDLGPNISQMLAMDELDLKMATAAEYRAYLQDAGFCTVSLLSVNEHYIKYTSDNIARIDAIKADLIQAFNQDYYEYSLKSWMMQRKIFELNEVSVTLLKAAKPLVD